MYQAKKLDLVQLLQVPSFSLDVFGLHCFSRSLLWLCLTWNVRPSFVDLVQEFYRLRSSLRAKQEHASLLDDFREFDRSRLELEDGLGTAEQTLLKEHASVSRSTGQVSLPIIIICMDYNSIIFYLKVWFVDAFDGVSFLVY